VLRGDAAGSTELVERYGAMAAGIAWTRAVLDQAGLLDILTGLRPRRQLSRYLPSQRAVSTAFPLPVAQVPGVPVGVTCARDRGLTGPGRVPGCKLAALL
jgi:hypothetical protein